MSKYIVNMADQLNLIRANAQEKLRKEAEVVVEVEKPSALQTAAVDYLSRKDEPHPLSQNKNLNEETLDEGKMDGAAKDLEKEAKQNKGSMDEKSYKVMAKLMKQGNPKQILSYYKGLDTEPRERIAMILKKNIGEKQAGKILSVSFSNNREEVELDENVNSDIKKILDKEKISYKIQTSKHPLGQKGIITGVFVQAKDEKKASIALGKISPYPHTITTHAEEVDLDEIVPAIMAVGRVAAAGAAIGSQSKEQKLNAGKEKSVRQLINPTKEVMIVKKNKVIVIDKKDQDKYMKQGWTLAEEEEVEEAKLIDKPTGEVLKTGSKEKMETEKKRNRDELQVKEWFKLKNIDVKVRELDESTQVYVPLGRRIPNEIREELIKTQYGKMPEDVKNVKDINYGNFMENSITMNNDFWTKVLHDTKGE